MSLTTVYSLTRISFRLKGFRTVHQLCRDVEHELFKTMVLSQRFISKDVKDTSSSSESSSDDSSSSDEEDNKKAHLSISRQLIESKSFASPQKLNTLLRATGKQQETNSMKNVTRGPEKEKSTINGVETSGGSRNRSVSEELRDMQEAVKKVAHTLGGDVKKTESELLNRLFSQAQDKGFKKAPKKTVNLSELIVGMQIDRTPSTQESPRVYQKISRIIGESPRSTPRMEQSLPEKFHKGDSSDIRRHPHIERQDFQIRREQIQEEVPSRSRQPSISSSLLSEGQPLTSRMEPSSRLQSRGLPTKVNIFGEEPLGIFSPSTEFIQVPTLKTWKHLQERELKLAVTHPPANYFEEMILWTEKGMTWKFPINNEQGMEQEEEVPFSEHIFLEKHLVPWCPSKGPIRHFMELVCIGLSKNPYITVEEKKAHILWFKEYFEAKSDVLQSVGISLNSVQDQTKLSE